MKSLRFVVSAVLMSVCAVALAQSDAQKSFDKLKTLAGTWEGHVTTVPAAADVQDKLVQVSLRVTSEGNALLHEMTNSGSPDDPITMFYMDGDRLLLTHYCDAGNRPRMTAKLTPDGKTVDFEFLDVAGSTQHGHMQHVMFTFADTDHHSEEWTFLMPDGKPMRGRIDLQRIKK